MRKLCRNSPLPRCLAGSMSEERNVCKWVDEWLVPGLSSEHRKKIKAHLLRADGAFERLPDADPEAAARQCMRQAFDGIAHVLFDAQILTTAVLRTDIPQLVWDSAIVGGWWRRYSETQKDIFPEPCGDYWVWREDSRESKELFRAEARDWEAKLLEAPGQDARAAKIKALSEPAQRPGYRTEVRQWMARQNVTTVHEAARRLNIGVSALKSMMSTQGKPRYGQATLDRILRVIGCPGE